MNNYVWLAILLEPVWVQSSCQSKKQETQSHWPRSCKGGEAWYFAISNCNGVARNANWSFFDVCDYLSQIRRCVENLLV